MSLDNAIQTSGLYDESTFYPKFEADMLGSSREIIIESPFITTKRMKLLYPMFDRLIRRGIKVFILTRDPREHSEGYKEQSEAEIQRFERLGVQVFICTGNHHRKLAILDKKILWEGSLNILSQIKSREIMRRIDSEETAGEMYEFLKLGRFI